MKKIAFITGITGQEGAYLAEILLKKKYVVHGLIRRSSLIKTDRIDHIYNNKKFRNKFFLHYGDMTDGTNLISIIKKIQPNIIYNLAAQSHVKVSFETPEYTANADALGTLRLLEAIRILNFQNKTKFVLATGGGIITNEGSRNFLSKERTYFLDGSEEILYERSTRRREFRPLMKDMDIKGFSQLLKKRRQYYIESSIATIGIDKKNIDEVVDWIKNNEKNHF